jgi:hypothetical protein
LVELNFNFGRVKEQDNRVSVIQVFCVYGGISTQERGDVWEGTLAPIFLKVNSQKMERGLGRYPCPDFFGGGLIFKILGEYWKVPLPPVFLKVDYQKMERCMVRYPCPDF